MAPSQRDSKKQVFSVSFEKDLIAEIIAICEANGMTGDYENRNAFIKKAVKEKLEKENQEKKQKNEN